MLCNIGSINNDINIDINSLSDWFFTFGSL